MHACAMMSQYKCTDRLLGEALVWACLIVMAWEVGVCQYVAGVI